MSAKNDIQLTEQEFNSFKNAMEKDEFKRLFSDYLQELADPKNREIYEKEIAALEAEAGNKVSFMQPEPGFVVKTFLMSNRQKVFINMCMNDSIEEATCETTTGTDGKKGQNWRIPYSLSAQRMDKDHGKLLLLWHDVYRALILELISWRGLLSLGLCLSSRRLHQRHSSHSAQEYIDFNRH